MKPRWLLLAVSLICLLVLFPAAALSQQPVLELGCGTPTIDGNVRPREWANAATVPLYAEPTDGVAPSQLQTGTAYFLNDGRYVYLGAVLDDPAGQVPDDPPWWELWMVFAFEDEPADDPAAWTDCAWEAQSCAAGEREDEGSMGASVYQYPGNIGHEDWFNDWAAPHLVCGGPAFDGLTFMAAPRGASAHYEMRVDLQTSPLNNPDPAAGDCFDLRWIRAYLYGETAATFGEIRGNWPLDPVDEDEPYSGECTVLCLNPCEVEVEFVPEPGSMLLLGTGLAGLAGYATLRWRARE